MLDRLEFHILEYRIYLQHRIAFVGGCVTGLLLTDPAAAPVRPTLDDEVHLALADLQKYLSGQFTDLLSNREFLDALPGHLLPDAASQERLSLVLKRMKQLIVEG